MRPRSLARAAIPGLHRMAPGPGGGWLTIKINSNFAQVYDKALTLTHSTPIPAAQRGSDIAADTHTTVLTRAETITAVHHDGTVAWRTPVTGETEPARSHLDPDGTLWLHLTGSHQLRALDITTGHEIDRTATPPGGSWFTHHARGEWPALNIAVHPPDDIRSWQPRLHDGRIHLRQLTADGHVAGFAGDYCVINAGMRMITQRHDGSDRTCREISDVPGVGSDTYLLEAGTTVGEDLIIVATAAGDHENHIVLSAPGLRYRARIDYPAPRGQNSLHPAAEAGWWLTRDYRSDVLELWALDGAVDDEIPGQLVLANPLFGPDEQIAGQLPLFDV